MTFNDYLKQIYGDKIPDKVPDEVLDKFVQEHNKRNNIDLSNSRETYES